MVRLSISGIWLCRAKAAMAAEISRMKMQAKRTAY